MAVRLDIHFAKCKNCGKDVGCGCHLHNGLCPSCYAQSVSKP
jgi:hypothetical protein